MTLFGYPDTQENKAAAASEKPAPPAPERPPRAGGRTRRDWPIVAVAIFVFLIVAGGFTLLSIGKWLVVEDPLAPAQAIVVLSGGMPYRAIEAARLYKQNMAPDVWISRGLAPPPQLAQLNIPFLGEEFYSEKILLTMGVQADAIRILEDPSANTYAEVEEIARDLRQESAHTVIIVTSKAHTRRVRYIWKKLVGNDPRLIVRYVGDDPFDASHWWRHTQDALDVSREVLGLANAWAGFPLKPGPRQ